MGKGEKGKEESEGATNASPTDATYAAYTSPPPCPDQGCEYP